MKKLVRCKACGYIMLESKLKDRCPACGVPSQMFEPYADPMSEPRRRVLDFDLHPIAVHFPTSFAVAILVFSIASIFFRGPVQELLISATKVLALFLPLVVIIALAAGIVDGRIRFRGLRKSQILKKKVRCAALFLIFSIGLALTLWLGGLGTILFNSIAVVLAAANVGCTVVLALLGMQILNAAFPG
jgi:uncharacterized protein (DUF983 family)